MILVRVNVPCIDKAYDAKIDEDMPIIHVIKELSGLVCSDVQCEKLEDYRGLLLFDNRTKRPLVRELSAYENGVVSGSELTLA